MPPPKNKLVDLREQADRMLKAEGMSFEDLQLFASDIVVFGSRAVGRHRPDSDLDLLIVGKRSEHKRVGNLDLIYLPQSRIKSILWRRTEIARHIATYGVSLMHDYLCVDSINDDYAAMRKQMRLRRLIRKLLPCWHILDEALKLKYLTRVRRELQRYRLLKRGIAVPPTAELDRILELPNWPDVAFEDLENTTGISQDEAQSARQTLTLEGWTVQRKIRRSGGGRHSRVA
jgi:predicted nucleotidyltransferase